MLTRLITVGGLVMLTAGLLWCDLSVHSSEFCRECQTWRRVHTRAWGWSEDHAFEYSRSVTQGPDTALRQDFHATGHEHGWMLSLEFYSRCLGYFGDGHGDGRFPSPIGAAYNGDPRFRDFIQGLIASGHLHPMRFQKLVATLDAGDGPEAVDLFSDAAELLGRREFDPGCLFP